METINYMAIDSYCAKRIHRYAERVSIALDQMDMMRCPLYMADPVLYDEMNDAIVDWCDEHEVSIDFYEDIDPEEVIFNA